MINGREKFKTEHKYKNYKPHVAIEEKIAMIIICSRKKDDI